MGLIEEGKTMLEYDISFDYLCPFARNAHEAVVRGLEEGRPWKVNFRAFSLAQAHTSEDDPAVWDNPAGQSGLDALQWGVAIRDTWPELFGKAHLALFAARHDHGLDLKDTGVLAEAVAAAGCDPDAVAEVVATGEPLCKIAGEHMKAVDQWMAFGFPPSSPATRRYSSVSWSGTGLTTSTGLSNSSPGIVSTNTSTPPFPANPIRSAVSSISK